MVDTRTILPFVLIALSDWLLYLLAQPAAAVLKVWLRHGHRMFAGDSTKKHRPPRRPLP
ncbi:MAG: hypothetical protein WB402_13230 [Sulfuricaulis sp.]|uniref:hypothetical protein n=1 Tax=Sulfuricaulis sp. TaxID=2003553 RepID=UPI003C4F488E